MRRSRALDLSDPRPAAPCGILVIRDRPQHYRERAEHRLRSPGSSRPGRSVRRRTRRQLDAACLAFECWVAGQALSGEVELAWAHHIERGAVAVVPGCRGELAVIETLQSLRAWSDALGRSGDPRPWTAPTLVVLGAGPTRRTATAPRAT